jgi:hypothetical protein
LQPLIYELKELKTGEKHVCSIWLPLPSIPLSWGTVGGLGGP